MKLIAGLGNPEKRYENTRHNAGFMFVDQFYKWLSKNCGSSVKFTISGTSYELDNAQLTSWEYEKLFDSDISYLKINSEKKIILVKPRTYMNKSGEAIIKVMKKNQVSVEEIVVAYDDLDIQLGKYKISLNKSPKAHNGVISIENFVKSLNFVHVRIGIESRAKDYKIPGQDYVLMKMNVDEYRLILIAIDDAVQEVIRMS